MSVEAADRHYEMKSALERYLKDRFPEWDGLSVVHLEKSRLSASHDIFMLTVRSKGVKGQGSENLVIRMVPDTGVHQSYDLARECEAIRKMHACRVPVPRIYCLEEDSAVLGHPFVIMEKIEGEKLLDTWMRQPEHRPQLVEDLYTVLAKIHSVDWRLNGLAFLGEPEHSRSFAEREIVKWQRVLKGTEYSPHPVMAEVAIWLKRNAPPSERTTVCHGDYSVLNAHVHGGRIVAILDWEMVGLGDPVSDIAALCNMAGTMRIADWDEGRFVRGYEERTGTKVSAESLAFWKIMGCFAMAAVTVSGTRSYIESKDPSMREMFNFHMLHTVMQDIAAKSIGF